MMGNMFGLGVDVVDVGVGDGSGCRGKLAEHLGVVGLQRIHAMPMTKILV